MRKFIMTKDFNITSENFISNDKNITTTNIHNIPVKIKYTLSFEEMTDFISSVLIACDNNGDFSPEVRRIAETVQIIEKYTNIPTIKEIEHSTKLTYETDIIDIIVKNINQRQLKDMRKAIDQRIGLSVKTHTDASASLYYGLSGLLKWIDTKDVDRLQQKFENIANEITKDRNEVKMTNGINKASLKRKIYAIINEQTKENAKEIGEQMANKFCELLYNAISTSGLSDNAIDRISDFSHTVTVLNNGEIQIDVYFNNKQSNSLFPEKYDGINNIVLLLNDGVDHTMQPVYGEWHGERIKSRTEINGIGFLEKAINDFKNICGSAFKSAEINRK